MDWKIDHKSGIPLYVQLKDNIKLAIATGKYLPGSQLPTVRQLAVALRINVNTIARAYSELEREEFITTQQGRGTFVLQKEFASIEKHFDTSLERLFKQLLLDAHNLGLTPEETVHKLLEYVNAASNTRVEKQGG